MLTHYLHGKTLSLLLVKEGFFALEIHKQRAQALRFFPIKTSNKKEFASSFIKEIDKEFSHSYDIVDVATVTKNVNVVPNDVFDNYAILDYYTISVPYFSNDSLRFSRAIEEDVSVAYTYNDEIEAYLEEKFSCVRYIHAGSRLIDKSKNGINAVFHGSQMEVCIKKNNELILYSVEELSSPDLILSYLQNAIEKSQLQEAILYLYGRENIVDSVYTLCHAAGMQAQKGNEQTHVNELFSLVD